MYTTYNNNTLFTEPFLCYFHAICEENEAKIANTMYGKHDKTYVVPHKRE